MKSHASYVYTSKFLTRLKRNQYRNSVFSAQNFVTFSVNVLLNIILRLLIALKAGRGFSVS